MQTNIRFQKSFQSLQYIMLNISSRKLYSNDLVNQSYWVTLSNSNDVDKIAYQYSKSNIALKITHLRKKNINTITQDQQSN